MRAVKALRPADAGELEPERDILDDRLPGQQSVLLEDDAAIGAGACDLDAVERDRAGRERQEARHGVEQRRLPAARGAERDHERPIGNVERDPIKRVHGPPVAGGKEDACFVNAQHELMAFPSRAEARRQRVRRRSGS